MKWTDNEASTCIFVGHFGCNAIFGLVLRNRYSSIGNTRRQSDSILSLSHVFYVLFYSTFHLFGFCFSFAFDEKDEKEKFEAEMQKITFTYLFFLDNLNAFQPIPCEHLQETLTTNNLILSCNSKTFLYSVHEVFKESSDTFPFFYYFQIFFSFLTQNFF